MRVLVMLTLGVALAGCTFGVKTCSSTDPCLGGGQCVQGVCTIPPGSGGGGGGEEPELDAGTDAGVDAGVMGGGTGGGGSVTFDAGPHEGIVFLTPPRSTAAGACSEEIQVGVFDDGDAGVLSLAFVNEEAVFFGDRDCASTPSNEFTIPASRVVSIYFRSSSVGSVLISATTEEGQEGVHQVQSVVSGPAGRLAFGAPVSVQAGACSAPVSVLVRDDFGNVATVKVALPVTLKSDSASTQFFDGNDSSCSSPLVPSIITLAAGASSSAFRFRDSNPGLPSFNADAPDGGVEGPIVQPASQEQVVY